MKQNDWKLLPFTEAISDRTSLGNKKPQIEFQSTGSIPIVDQGAEFVAGYTDDHSLAWQGELPAIVFGDHTRAFKFVDFPFVLGADGVKVLIPSKALNPKFVYYYLGNLNIPSHGYSRHFRYLKEYNIPVPPLPEQARIVKLLDEADALRKLRAQADTRTAELIPALFDAMFGNPETNPKKWPVRSAGELMSDCDYGTSQKSDEDVNGVTVLRMGNVTFAGQLDLTNLKTVLLPENELRKQLLRAGDVLFNRTNSRELVGKTGMWDGRFEAVAASYFIRVRFNPEREHPQHFVTFMNLPSTKHRLAEMARGAIGQANINSQELKSIQVPVPPLPLQKEFAACVAAIRELGNQQSASRSRLEALFQSMLHKAFRGEL